jgi:flagellum-specific peptidoglycan hydrolase FlgJ
MYRFLILFILVMSTKEYKLCNAAILPPEMPMACFEENDPILEFTPPPVVVTAGSVPLDELIKDKTALEYLSKNEVIKRAVYGAKVIGCQPSVILIQDALESGWGKSNLCLKTNNSGNVKCRCNKNKKLRKKHIETGACVAGYDKIEGSYDRYIKFNTRNDGWAKKINTLASYKVIKNAPKDLSAEEWCMVFCKSPYATDKRYGKKMIRSMNDVDFKNIDTAIAKGLTITSSTGKYVFYEAPKEPKVEILNYVTFPDEDDFYESTEVRTLKRNEWKAYVQKNKGHALAAQQKYGVPASWILAEGLIESNCGRKKIWFNGRTRDAYLYHAKEIGKDYYKNHKLKQKLIHIIEDMELQTHERSN